MSDLILSVFPGIDLLGRAFELEGFCVVRGPDPIFGGDIRAFFPPPGHFYGIIGGSPCQDFSTLRRSPPSGYGIEMLEQFRRVIYQAAPEWYLLENVPSAPDLYIPGYTHQRIDLKASETGSRQSRNRHFQFGSLSGYALIIERSKPKNQILEPICTASEGTNQNRRSWPDFCELMDLPRDFKLPGWSIKAKYRAVGQGVPVNMGRTLARGIKALSYKMGEIRLCACGCGRLLQGKQKTATVACRKRLQRKRERARELS